MFRQVIAAVIAVLILVGCGGEVAPQTSESGPSSQVGTATTTTRTTHSTAATTAPSVAPGLQSEVVHTYFTSDPFARFVVKFTNPADQMRVGAVAEWRALDKDGVIVGSHTTKLPPIAPGGTWYYVAGAGSALLTGTPASAKVTVTTEGSLVEGAPTSLVAAEKSEFAPSDFDLHGDAKDYEVVVVVAASGDVTTANIKSGAILYDASGKILGADWLDFTSAPESLRAGDKVKGRARVAVREGTPAKVVVYIWGG